MLITMVVTSAMPLIARDRIKPWASSGLMASIIHSDMWLISVAIRVDTAVAHPRARRIELGEPMSVSLDPEVPEHHECLGVQAPVGEKLLFRRCQDRMSTALYSRRPSGKPTKRARVLGGLAKVRSAAGR